MFTLRKVFPDDTELNIYLGDMYMVVRASLSPEQYGRLYRDLYEKDWVTTPDGDTSENDPYAFVCGEENHGLFKSHYNYIVSDNGRTFENLSFKS